MVRMRVRQFAAALGVIIAIAMTPRAALAVTLEDFPSSPTLQYKVGSTPELLKPSEVLSGITISSNVYPNMSIGEVYGGYSYTGSGSITNNTGTTAITSEYGYGYDRTTPLSRTYDYVVGNYSASNVTSGSKLYMDFYFVSDDWSTFPVGVEYSVVTPSLVSPYLFQFSNDSTRPSAYVMRMPSSAFVVDSVKYYRQSIVAQQPNEQWVDVPSNALASMRYPFHAKAQSGTLGLKGFVIRGHLTVPSYSTSSSYDQSLFFGLDNLKIRTVIYDSDVMATINGSSSQSSTGVPVTTTITTSTQNQTNTLMDTNGSEDIVSGLTGGGSDGFVSRFGFVAQTLDIVKSFYQAIVDSQPKYYIDFPGVTVLGYTLIPAQQVYIWQNGLTAIYQPVSYFLHGLMCINWVIWIYNDFRSSFLDLEDAE